MLGRTLSAMVALLAVPAVLAASGAGTVTSNGEAVIDRAQGLAIGSNGIEAAAAGPFEIGLTLVDVTSARIIVLTQSQLRVNLPERNMTFDEATSERDAGPVQLGDRLTVASVQEGAIVRVLPVGGLLDVSLPGREPWVRLGPTGEHWPQVEDVATARVARIAGGDARPQGVAAVANLDLGHLEVAGPLTILATGVRATDGRTTVTATRSVDEDASAVDPATGSGRLVEDIEVLVIEASAVVVEAARPDVLKVGAVDLQALVHGTSRWSGVLAAADVDGNPLPLEAGLLEFSGLFEATGRFDGEQATWSFAGEIDGVAVNGSPWLPPAAAAPVALSLVAAIALAFTKAGKAALTFLVGRHTPRLVKAEALGSPTRRRILELVHAQQPVTLQDVTKRLSISATNAAYHLRILESHAILQTTRPAGHMRRNTLYMLNSGSLQARVPVTGGDASEKVELDVALGAVNSNPVRQEIFAAILEHGPSTYEQLVARGPDGRLAGLSRSTAAHHLQSMVQSGVLRATKEGRSKAYAVNVVPGQARTIQYRSFLLMHGLMPTFEAIVSGRFTTEGDVARFGATRDGVRQTRARLRQLVDLGMVTHAHGVVAPAPWLQPFAKDILAAPKVPL